VRSNTLATCSILLLFSCGASAAQPRLAVDSPRGGEYYFEGQVQQIRVLSRIKSLVVELSRDGGVSFEKLGIIDNTVRDASLRGVLNWKVTLPESRFCIVRVSDSAGLFTQVSQQFRIAAIEGSGVIPGGTITSNALATSAVTTSKLADQAVDETKLADGSVTNPKLADNAVTTPKLSDLSVTSQKISSGPASSQFLLAADGNGGATWVTPGSIPVTPNFGNQPIVTTNSVTAGSVVTGDLNVSGTLTLPPNSISSAALPATVTLQGNTFNGANQLVRLDNGGKLPALDGSALINLTLSTLGGQNAAYYLNRTNHTGTQTASTISDFDTQVRTSRLDQMAAPTGSVSLNTQKVINLADPTAAQDAATKSYVDTANSTFGGQNAAYYLNRTNHTGTQTASTISDFDTQVRTSRLDQMAVPTGSVSLNTQKVTNLADPTAVQDAATKNYVDTANSTLGSAKVSKAGDSMSGTLTAAGNGVKIVAQAGAGDAGSVTKLEVQRSDNSTAFNVTANGDVNVGGIMTLQKAGIPAVVTLASSGNVATDASLGNVFSITLSGNITLDPPSNPTSGQRCLWRLRQPAAGGPFTASLDTGVGGFRFGVDIPAISLSTGANKVDYIGAIWNATDSKWDVIAFVQGY